MKTQKQLVLEHIKKYGSITDYEAVIKYHIMRLGSVVHSLRKDGHIIITNMRPCKNKYRKNVRYGVYTMGEEEKD